MRNEEHVKVSACVGFYLDGSSGRNVENRLRGKKLKA